MVCLIVGENMKLLAPLKIGSIVLKNRIVMAPLGRARADADRVPTELMTVHYTQRASAGLIIAEACHISPQSATRRYSVAQHSEQQSVGWADVVKSVHAAGGHIFQQLTHVGRKALLSGLPNGETPVAPSAIAAYGGLVKNGVLEEFPVPRALEPHEIAPIVDDFRSSARLADKSGFDGIELLAANGFLLDQFLRDETNRRTDNYGGSVENRARFLLEVVDAAIGELGAKRVAVRLSPHFRGDRIGDSDPVRTFSYLAEELNKRGIGFIHLVEGTTHDDEPFVPLYERIVKKPGNVKYGPLPGDPFLAPIIRNIFEGALVLCGGYDRETAEQVVADGLADAVAFGRLYIANPDIPERFRINAPLNDLDPTTYTTEGPKGYTDYPFLKDIPHLAANQAAAHG